MGRVCAGLAAALLAPALLGCAPAASDDDGEVFVAGPPPPAAAKEADAVPVVVDTDLAPDDLAALALLARHPRVEVLAVTVPETGVVTCLDVELVEDLFEALRMTAPPVACGTTPRGEHGLRMPPQWTLSASTMSGLERDQRPGRLVPVRRPAARLIAHLARRHTGLQVVALAPLTELAAVLRESPGAYARLAGITAMAGVVEQPSYAGGIGEWNAAADPTALAEVLDGPVPVTLVPGDAVPMGAPAGLAGPVVGALGREPGFESPAYWDLATAGAFVRPDAVTAQTGSWDVDVSGDRGRLRRTGDGAVHVVTGIDAPALDEVYLATFG